MFSKNKIVKHEEYEFSIGDELSDMKLIVENEIVFVHKAILGIFYILFQEINLIWV